MLKGLKQFYKTSVLFQYGFTEEQVKEAMTVVLLKAKEEGEISIDSFVETLNKKRNKTSQLPSFVGEALLLEFEKATDWLRSEIYTSCHMCSHEIKVRDYESQFTSRGLLKCLSCQSEQPFVVTEMAHHFYLTEQGEELCKRL